MVYRELEDLNVNVTRLRVGQVMLNIPAGQETLNCEIGESQENHEHGLGKTELLDELVPKFSTAEMTVGLRLGSRRWEGRMSGKRRLQLSRKR